MTDGRKSLAHSLFLRWLRTDFSSVSDLHRDAGSRDRPVPNRPASTTLIRSRLLIKKGSSLEQDTRENVHICKLAFRLTLCNAGDPASIPELGRSAGEGIGSPLQYSWASLVAQLVKNLPAMQETWVQSLDWEDLLERGMATYSNILARRIPWTEKSGDYSPWGPIMQETQV